MEIKYQKDETLEFLLDLHGECYVVDEALGLWVKFEAWKVPAENRKQGVRYSLSLHDRANQRIMGFDNAHVIEYDGKRYIPGKRTFDHCHFHEKDRGQPYFYQSAAKLLEDFWAEVDKKIKIYYGERNGKIS